MNKIFIGCLLVAAAHAAAYRLKRDAWVDPRDPDPEFLWGTFPEGFMWGTSTAAGQVEGAVDVDGRGPSIWDVYAQIPGKVTGGDTPEIAADSYNKWREDVQLAKNLGQTHYRFSISWSRVMSDGTLATVNEAGIKYYDNLINGLLEAGVQPMVTLYHNDLPNALQEKYRGWLGRETIPHYVDYARLMFQRFGDRVKWWSTFNEVHIMSMYGFGIYGSHAPGLLDWQETAVYNVTQHTLLAHAEAYHVYDKEFRASQQGKIGQTFDMNWIEPFDANNADDVAAAERQRQLDVGLIAHPIYSKEGDWPAVIKEYVAKKSAAQGYATSRLPAFTPEEIERIKGTADYFSLNQYTVNLVKHQEQPLQPVQYLNDVDAQAVDPDPNWKSSGSPWLKQVPWGMRSALNWIKNQYDNIPVIITEQGMSDVEGPDYEDDERIVWLREYINNILKAIKKDGCNVFGYTIWSAMDNFEWAGGYGQRFGIVGIDFTDPNRPRKPKKSYYWYQQVIKDHGFVKGNYQYPDGL